MLSYRHAFHAGNHADVLKHLVLLQSLRHATRKEKPLWYVDSHAGAGSYALDQGYALKNGEFTGGIGRLWEAEALPPALEDYLSAIRACNPDRKLRRYPGSPWLAHAALRAQDRLRLFELHPSDHLALQQLFESVAATEHNRTIIARQDGFAALRAVLPPPTRRALVLIDPPYEAKQDYEHLLTAVTDCLRRFATGTYILWYPLLQRPEPHRMVERLKRLVSDNWLDVTLSVQAPAATGFGMHGSGLFIINPAWTLPALLADTLPALRARLALDDSADFTLESRLT